MGTGRERKEAQTYKHTQAETTREEGDMERNKREAQTDTQAETTGEDGDMERKKRGTDR